MSFFHRQLNQLNQLYRPKRDDLIDELPVEKRHLSKLNLPDLMPD